jgi:D-sedoheptulose 7-phosphate isomerase
MKNYIKKQIIESTRISGMLLDSDDILKNLEEAALECIAALKNNKKILLAGNGGSAADAQHIAGEFVGRFMFNRPPLRAIALTTDTSIMTAIVNDYGVEEMFSRQLDALGDPGDIFMAYSTSGSSPNIINALKKAKEKGLISIGLTGNKKGEMVNMCDYILEVPSSETPRIQECHLLLGHTLCGIIEENLFADEWKQ